MSKSSLPYQLSLEMDIGRAQDPLELPQSPKSSEGVFETHLSRHAQSDTKLQNESELCEIK